MQGSGHRFQGSGQGPGFQYRVVEPFGVADKVDAFAPPIQEQREPGLACGVSGLGFRGFLLAWHPHARVFEGVAKSQFPLRAVVFKIADRTLVRF